MYVGWSDLADGFVFSGACAFAGEENAETTAIRVAIRVALLILSAPFLDLPSRTASRITAKSPVSSLRRMLSARGFLYLLGPMRRRARPRAKRMTKSLWLHVPRLHFSLVNHCGAQRLRQWSVSKQLFTHEGLRRDGERADE